LSLTQVRISSRNATSSGVNAKSMGESLRWGWEFLSAVQAKSNDRAFYHAQTDSACPWCDKRQETFSEQG
jgi:hypothetical protein